MNIDYVVSLPVEYYVYTLPWAQKELGDIPLDDDSWARMCPAKLRHEVCCDLAPSCEISVTKITILPFSFLLRKRYGSFRISEPVLAEYERRRLILDPTAPPLNKRRAARDESYRWDPIMVESVQHLEGCDNFVVVDIDAFWDGFIRITEYDGYENFEFMEDACKLHYIDMLCKQEDRGPMDTLAEIKRICNFEFNV